MARDQNGLGLRVGVRFGHDACAPVAPDQRAVESHRAERFGDVFGKIVFADDIPGQVAAIHRVYGWDRDHLAQMANARGDFGWSCHFDFSVVADHDLFRKTFS